MKTDLIDNVLSFFDNALGRWARRAATTALSDEEPLCYIIGLHLLNVLNRKWNLDGCE